MTSNGGAGAYFSTYVICKIQPFEACSGRVTCRTVRRGARVSDRRSWTVFFWVNAALGASILLFWGAEGEAKLLEGVDDEGDGGWNEELCDGWRDNFFRWRFAL